MMNHQTRIMIVKGLLGAIVIVMLFMLVLSQRANNATLRALNDSLQPLLVAERAEDVVRGFIANPYNVQDRLCAGNDVKTAMCTMVSATTIPPGTHDALWMGLDNASALDANLPYGENLPMRRAHAELVAALSQFGAYRLANEDDSPAALTTVLYRATVAQALICQRMQAEVDCVSGLPKQTTTALRNLMALVAEEGPRVAKYDTGPRMPAVLLVMKGL